MKKTVSLILAMLMLFAVLSLSACGKNEDKTGDVNTNTDIVLSLGNSSGAAGSRIAVPLEVKNAAAIKNYGNGTLVAVELKVKTNAEQLPLASVKSAFDDSEDGSQWLADSSVSSDGTYKIVIMDNNLLGISPDEDVTLATLYFSAAATAAGEYDVELELVDICDTDADSAIQSHTTLSGAKVIVE